MSANDHRRRASRKPARTGRSTIDFTGRRAALTAAALGVFAGAARAASYTWDNTSGDYLWNTASNWDLDIAPAAADTAVFSSSSSGVSGSISLAGTRTVDTVHFSQATAGYSVIGGTLQTNTIRRTGSGSASVGAAVQSIGSTLTLDNTVTAGLLQIDGSVTMAAGTTVNKTGAGLVQLGGGGSVADLMVDAGTVEFSASTFTASHLSFVDGNGKLSGGTLNNTGSVVFVGDGSSNVVTFDQTAGTFNTTGLLIGRGASSGATYNLSGAGSILSSSGTTTVGAFGTGTFNQSGGSFTTNALTVASGTQSGNYNMSGGTLNVSGATIIGNSNNAVGTFTQTGGTATLSGNFVFANTAGTTATYTGSGGTLSAANIYVGGHSSGAGGVGTFTVNAGSSVSTAGTFKVWNSGASALNLAGGSLSVGTLDLGGDPSRLNWTAGTLHFASPQNFVVQSGGLLGQTLNIGAGKHLTGNALMYIGSTGTGALNITGGGTVSSTADGASSAIIGHIGGSDGTVLVDGAGSSWTTAGVVDLIVGNSGTGQLTVQNGGTVTTSGGLRLGMGGGSGVVNIATGSTVNVAGTLRLYNSGSTALNFSGGTINAATLDNGGAAGRFDWTGGTLNLGSLDVGVGLGSGYSLGAGDGTLNVAGTTTVGTGTTLTLTGGAFSTGALAGSGTVNTGGTLNLTLDSGNVAFNGTIAGAGGITKTGIGTIALSGANTYTGNTVISGGAIETVGDERISDASVVTVNAGALGIGGDETIANFGGGSGGNVVIGTGRTLTFGGNNAFSGFSGNLLGDGTLRKVGTGVFLLHTPSLQYTGELLVNGGTFRIENDFGGAGARIRLAGGTVGPEVSAITLSRELTVDASGGTIEVGSGLGMNFTGGLRGTGTFTKTGAGTLTLATTAGATYDFTGAINLNQGVTSVSGREALGSMGSSAPLIFSGGTLSANSSWTWERDVLLTGNGSWSIGSGTSTNTITGSLAGSGTLTKTGTGVVTLAGSTPNLNTGLLVVSQGILSLNKSGGFHATTGDVQVGTAPVTQGQLRWGGNNQLADSTNVTIVNGQLNLATFTDTINSLTLSGTGPVKTIAGAAGSSLTVANGTMMTGSGTLNITLNGVFNTNSFGRSTTGITQIGGTSTLAVGAGGVTINHASVHSYIQISGTSSNSGRLLLGGDVTFAGTNDSYFGILDNAPAGSLSGSLDLGGQNRTFSVANTDATDELTISARIINGGLTKTGAGTLLMGGATVNTYTGDTIVNAGTLWLSKTAGVNAIAGNLLVNSGGTVLWNSNEQIADTATLTVNAGGTINLAGRTETIGGFADNGGTTILGGGQLVIAGAGDLSLGDGSNVASNVTLEGDLLYTGSTTGATVSGNISLTGATTAHEFNINDGAAAIDTLISGVISGSSHSITKTGAGTLRLSAANTYTGGTTISAGTLVVANAAALGTGSVTNGANLVVAAGTDLAFAPGAMAFHQNGGTLTIDGSLNLSDKTFNYNGGTVAGTVTMGGASLTTLNLGAGLTGASGGTFLFNGSGGTIAGNTTSAMTLTVRPSTFSSMFLNVGSTFTNNGTMTLASNSTEGVTLNIGGSTGTMTNAGTFTIDPGSTGSPVRSIEGAFVNTGATNVNSSATFRNVTNSGAFTIAAGQTAGFAPSNYSFTQSAGTLTVNGTLSVSDKTFNYNGGTVAGTGTVTFGGGSISTLNLGAGLTGASGGTFLFNGSGGTITGNTTSAMTLNIRPSNFSSMFLNVGSTFTNAGAMTLSSNSNEGVTLNIGGSTGTMTNTGTFNINGGSGGVVTRQIEGSFINSGTTNVNSSTTFRSITNSGAFSIATGQTLTMGPSNYSFTHNGGTLAANGSLVMNDKTFNYNGGNVTGTVTMGGGSITTLNLAGGLTNTSGGTFLFNGSGGTISGNTTSAMTLTVRPSNFSSMFLNVGSAFTNAGTMTLASNSNEGVTLNIGGSTGTMTNTGTLTIGPGSGGVVTRQIEGSFVNSGTTNVNSSTTFRSITNSGAFSIASGQTLSFGPSNYTFTQSAGTLAVNGSMVLNDKTFNYNGGNVTGTLTMGGGSITTLNLAAGLTNTSGGTFLFNGSGGTIAGNLTSAMTLSVRPSNLSSMFLNVGSAFTNAGTMTLASNSNEGVTLNIGGSTGTMTNSGTFTIDPGSGGVVTRQIEGSFVNSGTTSVNSSTTFRSITNSGAFSIASGQTLSFGPSNYSFTQSAGTLAVNGTLLMNDKTLNYNGGTVTGTVSMGGGSITTLNLGAGLTSASGGTFLFNGSGGTISGNMTSAMTLTVRPAQLSSMFLNVGSTFTNAGTMTLASNSSEGVTLNIGGGTGTFTNTGTLTIDPGTAGATRQVSGTFMNAAAGTTNINADTTFGAINNAGAFTVAGGRAVTMSAVTALTLSGGSINLASDSAVGAKFRLGGTVFLDASATAGATIASTGAGAFVGNLDLNGGTRTFNVADTAAAVDLTISAAVVGSGALTKQGSGVLLLSGANTFNGPLTIQTGTVRFAGGNALRDQSNVSLASAGSRLELLDSETVGTVGGPEGSTIHLGAHTLTAGASNGNGTFIGTIVGTGGLVKIGTGTQSLQGTAASTYSGLTTVNAGTLRLIKTAGVNAIGDDLLVNSGGTVLWAASEQIDDDATITLNSGGTLNLAGFTETVGGFFDNGGTTVLGTGGSLNVEAGDITLTDGSFLSVPTTLGGSLTYNGTTNGAVVGGTLTLAGTTTANHVFNIADGTSDPDVTIVGTISGASHGITKTGAGLLRLDGNNTYTGATIVSAGTLQTGAADRIHDSSDVIVNSGAQLVIIGQETLASLSGGGGVSVVGATGPLSIGADDSSTTFSGAISTSAGLRKIGGGTLTLGAAQGYGGATTIEAGTLALTSLSSGAFNYLGGNVTGNVTMSEAGAALTLASGLTGGGTFNFTGSDGSVSGNTSAAMTLNFAPIGGAIVAVYDMDAAFTNRGAITLGNANLASDVTLRAPLGGTGTITNEGSFVVHGLAENPGLRQIDGGFTNAATGTLAVNSNFVVGGNVTNRGAMTIAADKALGTNGHFTQAAGTLTVDGALLVAGTFFYDGGTINGAVTFGSGATLDVGPAAGAASFNFAGVTGTIAGDLAAGITLSTESETGGGTTTINVDDGFDNFGTIALGALNVPMSAALDVGAGGGGTMTNHGTLTVVPLFGAGDLREIDGTLINAAGATVNVNSNATINSITNHGTLSVSNGWGLWLDPTAGYTQDAGGVTHIGNAAVLVTGTGGLTFAGGSIDIGGGGQLDLNGPLAFRGETGTASISLAGVGGTPATVHIASGNHVFDIDDGDAAIDLDIAVPMIGPGGFTKVGGGTLQLAGGSSFGGAGTVVSINAGTLVASTDTAFGDAANTLTFAGGRLRAAQSFATSRGVTLGIGSGTIDVATDQILTLAGPVSGSGGITKTGTGTILLGNFANSFSGVTSVTAGTLRYGFSGAAPAGSIVRVGSGATVNLDGNSQTFASLSGDGALLLGAATLTAGGNNASTAFTGPITGTSGSIVKAGSGTMILSGPLAFGGGVSVNKGTLALSGPNTFGGDIAVAGGGTLRVSADEHLGAAGNSITLNNGTLRTTSGFATAHGVSIASGGGTIDSSGGDPLVMSSGISGTGNLTKRGSGTLRLNVVNPLTGQAIVRGGTVSVGAAGTLSDLAGITVGVGSRFDIDNYTAGANLNRIADDAPLLMQGGTFTFLGADGDNSGETFGALVPSTGASTIELLSGLAGTTKLTFSSLGTIGAGASVDFKAADLGGINKVIINSITTNGFLGGWATVNGTDFANYDLVNGIVPFTTPQYSGAFVANTHVRLTSFNPANPAPSVSIKTLNLDARDNAVNVAQAAGTTINLTESGLIKSGSNAASLSGGTITSSSGNIVVTTGGGDFTVNSAINGALTLSKGSTGTMRLTSADSQQHTLSGGIFLNAGILQIGSDANLGANFGNTTGVTFDGGMLETDSGAIVDVGAARTLAFATGGGTLNVGGALGAVTIDDANQLAGSGPLTKTGAGTLRITSANAFSGAVTVAGGNLELRNTDALGSGEDASVIRLDAGGKLTLRSDGPFPVKYDNNVIVSDNAGSSSATIDIGRASGPGIAGAFQLGNLEMNDSALNVTGPEGTLEFTGITTLRGDAEFNAARDLILSGPVTGVGSLVKTGGGALTLGGGQFDTLANTYAGVTHIKGGVLELNKAAGTNAIAGDIALDGGTMVLMRERQISDNSSMILAGGAFEIGDNTDSIQKITQTGGTLDVNGGALTVEITFFNGGTRTIGGTGSQAGAGGSSTDGTGSYTTDFMTVLDSGTNVNAGATVTVRGGGLTMSGSTSPTITLNSHAANPGKLVLAGNVSAQNTTGVARIVSTGPVPTAGTVDLSAAVRQFTVLSNMEVTGRVTNGGIRKLGAGTLKLTGPGEYGMGTTIGEGIVEVSSPTGLGTGLVTISNGLNRTLRLRSDIDATFGNDLTMTGGTVEIDRVNTGAGLSAGTIQLGRLNMVGPGADARLITRGPSGGTLQFTGPVTLGANMIVESHADTKLLGAIGASSPTFGVLKATGATAPLTLAGSASNTYTGLTRVEMGTLNLAKTAGALAVPGNLESIGTGIVLWQGNDQVADNALLMLTGASSSMNLNGFSDTVGDITMLGGTLATGAGTLRMNGNVTTAASGAIATISGNLSLGTVTRTFTVGDGAAADDLLVTAAISGTGGLNKAGPGALRLAGANTFTGGISVTGGTLHSDGPVAFAGPTNLAVDGGALSFPGALTTSAGTILTKTGAGALIVDGAQTHGAGTQLVAQQGSVTLSTDAGAGPNRNLSVVVGSSLDLPASQHLNAVTINTGGIVTMESGSDSTLWTRSLNIAGGVLQSNDNDLIVDYTGVSPEFEIRDLVFAFASNQNAASGISFTRAAGDRVLAIAERTEWGSSVFNGESIDDTTIVGRYTFYGDANLDGKVDSNDYVAVDVGLGTGDSWVQGDFNFSGSVTSDDYVAIDTNLGKGTANVAAFAELKADMIALHAEMFGAEYLVKIAEAEANGFAVVPEPGGVTTLGLAIGALLGGRRKRSRNHRERSGRLRHRALQHA